MIFQQNLQEIKKPQDTFQRHNRAQYQIIKKNVSGRICDLHGKVHLRVVRSTFCYWSKRLDTKVAMMLCTDASYHISTTFHSWLTIYECLFYEIHLWPFVKADFILIITDLKKSAGPITFFDVFRIEFQHPWIVYEWKNSISCFMGIALYSYYWYVWP
jgi:hypothetical protein